MTQAVADLPNRAELHLDFYDRTRIASRVRRHVGLIPWVRAKMGERRRDGSPYGAWAYDPQGIDSEFLLDETPRVHTDRKADGLTGDERGARRCSSAGHTSR